MMSCQRVKRRRPPGSCLHLLLHPGHLPHPDLLPHPHHPW